MTDEQQPAPLDSETLLELTTTIVSAFLKNNSMPAAQLPALISDIHRSLAEVSSTEEKAPAANQPPAVPVKKSVTPDYLICLEDGQKLKMLKRYLRTNFNMSPEEYRAKWNLPSDYPMVAPSYAEKRAEMAKAIGLGRGGRRRRA